MKLLVSLLFCIVAAVHGSCNINPIGIGNNPGEIPAAHITNLQTTQNLPYLWLALVPSASDNIVKNYETPIQFRIANIVGMNSYNVLAPYQEKALDIWGRNKRRICVEDFANGDDFNAHEQITGAYVFAYSIIRTMPETTEIMTNLMENVLGLPISFLDGSPPVGTPWGLVKEMVDEMIDYVSTDGWNADGSLANGANKMPYRDFDYMDENGNTYTKYKPRTSLINEESRRKICKSKNKKKKKQRKQRKPDPVWNWEPLLESNSFGFFCKQEHVTPHIGFTGRLLGVSEEEYEAFTSPLPTYDWCKEAEFALENTRVMANSDLFKMEVEFYDNKFFSLLPLQINWQIQQGFSIFQFWFFDMALDIAIYDAVMLVWRDKILFDLVRPTTVVQALKQDQEVQTYGGPGEGVKSINGMDWQPYIRTMPHAEYPSASSCLCTTFTEIMQELTGRDDTQGINLTQTFPAGSSKIEPGITPAKNLSVSYSKWSETNEACGRSRLNGGMHFSQAVPAGNQLCTGLAKLIADKARRLVDGDARGAMADFNDRIIHVKNGKTYPHPLYPYH